MKTNLRAGSQSATTFTRFMRSLGADRARRTLFGILIALVFLGAWAAWLFLARVTVYEITESARIESEGQATRSSPRSRAASSPHDSSWAARSRPATRSPSWTPTSND